jgi:hypothetical protein
VYINFIKGISLYKDDNSTDYSFTTIDKNALIRMIEDEHNEADIDLIVMIQYHSGKFTDEQLKIIQTRVRDIIKHNDKYRELRKAKEIEFI